MRWRSNYITATGDEWMNEKIAMNLFLDTLEDLCVHEKILDTVTWCNHISYNPKSYYFFLKATDIFMAIQMRSFDFTPL